MAIDVYAQVDENDIASAVVGRDISIFAIFGRLESNHDELVQDVHLLDEIDTCEFQAEDPVKAALFMKRLAESMIAKLRGNPDYDEQLPPEN